MFSVSSKRGQYYISVIPMYYSDIFAEYGEEQESTLVEKEQLIFFLINRNKLIMCPSE